MSGFIYKGKSTLNIIDRRLVLCGLDAVDDVIGVQRTPQTGDITITRPIPNEYGTTNEKLQFEYSLAIHPCETDTVPYITLEEQVIIERWLTSPKFSSNLYVINDNEDVLATYCGKFISTNWTPFEDGFLMCTFTFENDSAYAKEIRSYSFTNPQNTSGSWQFTIPCDTDELEEYVYPVIKITNTA